MARSVRSLSHSLPDFVLAQHVRIDLLTHHSEREQWMDSASCKTGMKRRPILMQLEDECNGANESGNSY
jgi:hypothetical protein